MIFQFELLRGCYFVRLPTSKINSQLGKIFCHLRHTSNEYPWTDKNEKVSLKNKWTKESSSKRELQWCLVCPGSFVHTVIKLNTHRLHYTLPL